MKPRRATFLALLLASAAVLLWRSGEGTRDAGAAAPAAAPARSAGAPVERGLPFALQPTSDAEVRVIVRFCRAAGPQDVSVLRRAATTSPSPLVAGNALRALGRLGRVVGDEELLAMLEDPRLRVRQELVLALGASGDRAQVEPLAALLARPDPLLRPLAIRALGRLGGASARDHLTLLLEEGEPSATERLLARQALTGS